MARRLIFRVCDISTRSAVEKEVEQCGAENDIPQALESLEDEVCKYVRKMSFYQHELLLRRTVLALNQCNQQGTFRQGQQGTKSGPHFDQLRQLQVAVVEEVMSAPYHELLSTLLIPQQQANSKDIEFNDDLYLVITVIIC